MEVFTSHVWIIEIPSWLALRAFLTLFSTSGLLSNPFGLTPFQGNIFFFLITKPFLKLGISPSFRYCRAQCKSKMIYFFSWEHIGSLGTSTAYAQGTEWRGMQRLSSVHHRFCFCSFESSELCCKQSSKVKVKGDSTVEMLLKEEIEMQINYWH